MNREASGLEVFFAVCVYMAYVVVCCMIRKPAAQCATAARQSIIGLTAAFALLAQSVTGDPMNNPYQAHVETAREILRGVPLIDGHNDLPWKFRRVNYDTSAVDLSVRIGEESRLKLITDIPRLREGGVGGQFWAVYVPPEPGGPIAVQEMLQQIDFVHELVRRYPHDFEFARTAADIERIHQSGRIASLIGLEGGHCINNSLAVLRCAYNLGARYMTLTHVKTTDWADAAGDVPRHHGLTDFGREVIAEMNRLGMLVDLSHVTDEVMRDTLDASKAPVIFSHSSARALCNHERNVPDDILQRLRKNRGIVMVCFLPGFLTDENAAHFNAAMAEISRLEALYPSDKPKAEAEMSAWRKANPAPIVTVRNVADHVMHLVKVAGIDHVGIGSDFEGFHGTVQGLEDVSKFPNLIAELLRRGMSREKVEKIAGRNFLRVFKQVEKVAESGAK
jgi:membrane dipeptidase